MKLQRVHGSEWLVGLGGALMLAGLFLDWYGDASAWGSLGFIVLATNLIGLAALLVPAVVASSRLTDVPIVWETLLWLFSLILLVCFLVRIAWQPAGGLSQGFWLSLVGLILAGLAGWRSVRREH